MESRKAKHIDVCLTEAVDFQTVTTGLERFRLPYNALTQTSLGAVNLGTEFLGCAGGARVDRAMTGGAELSGVINRNLAAAAQKLGIGMMLGSQRIMLDDDSASASFTVRDVAPDALLIRNIGLAQLSERAGTRAESTPLTAFARMRLRSIPIRCRKPCSTEGDTGFSGSIARLRDVAGSISYPVMLKEVGHGIGAVAAAELVDCPVAAVDVAGAGGTSWARVEQFVRYGEIRYPALAEWGIPTAQALQEVRHAARRITRRVRRHPHRHGRRQGALAMGADVVAVARPPLAPAIESTAAVLDWLQRFIAELRICLHWLRRG